MKTKITFTAAVLILCTLFGFSQSHVYNEVTSSGLWIASGAEITNPVSDAINSSATCIESTSGWGEVQFNTIGSYVVQSGDMLYFSIYNPNSAPFGQIRLNSWTTELYPADVNYSATTDAWVEYAADFSSFVGQTITQVKFFAGGDAVTPIYLDNVYLASASVLGIEPSNAADLNTNFVFSEYGNIHFSHDQEDTQVFVYDLLGRLVFDEIVNGSESTKGVSIRGTYIIKVVSDSGIVSKKIIY